MSAITEKTRVTISLVLMLGTGLISGVFAYAEIRSALAVNDRQITLHERRLDMQRDRLKEIDETMTTRIRNQDETLSELRRRLERIDVNILWMRDEMDERKGKGRR